MGTHMCVNTRTRMLHNLTSNKQLWQNLVRMDIDKEVHIDFLKENTLFRIGSPSTRPSSHMVVYSLGCALESKMAIQNV